MPRVTGTPARRAASGMNRANCRMSPKPCSPRISRQPPGSGLPSQARFGSRAEADGGDLPAFLPARPAGGIVALQQPQQADGVAGQRRVRIVDARRRTVGRLGIGEAGLVVQGKAERMQRRCVIRRVAQMAVVSTASACGASTGSEGRQGDGDGSGR